MRNFFKKTIEGILKMDEEKDTTLSKFLTVILVWVLVFIVYKYTGFGYMHGILGSLVLVVVANAVILILFYFVKKIFLTKKQENKEND